jgi:hypothetical protein
MSSLVFNTMFMLPRPGRLLLRIGFAAALPMTLLVLSYLKVPNLTFGIFVSLFAVLQVSTVLTTAHKEVLAASPSYFHRDIRRRLLCSQLSWAFGEAAVVALYVVFGYPDVGVAVTASALGAVLVAHALMALATLRLTWSYQLPFWIYYLFYAIPLLVRADRSGKVDGALNAPLYWLAAAAVLFWLLGRTMLGPHLHRRLCGTMVLGFEDLLRPSRLREYRCQADQRGRPGLGPRWRQDLIGELLNRADAARRRGRIVAARAWQLLTLDAAVNITTRSRVLLLVAVGTVAFMLFAGYYDGRASEGRLDRWFAGIMYQAAVWPFFSLSVVLLAAPPGAVSRRTAFRAEVGALAWSAVAALAAALVIAVAYRVLAAVLPPVHWRGEELVYVAPRLHGVWLAPLLGSFAWLGVALRPRPQCTLTNMILGPGFIVGHALLSSVPYHISAPAVGAASLVAFGVAYLIRRRWWERADIAL